jgi:hypothetical protein
MRELDDLKQTTNTTIMALQTQATAPDQKAVTLQTIHDTHQQNITNIPENNRQVVITTTLINNETTARQQLSKRINQIEAEDVGDRVTEMENNMGTMQRIETRYCLMRDIINGLQEDVKALQEPVNPQSIEDQINTIMNTTTR